MEEYLVPTRFGEDEFTEKKSRFIAHVAAAETVEQATEFIDSIKKKYWRILLVWIRIVALKGKVVKNQNYFIKRLLKR